jgi:hypothetical protein
MFLFVQSWDTLRGKEKEYTDFVLRRHLPALQGLGLRVAGAFHVIVGAGPRISHIITSEDFASLQKALDTKEFTAVTEEFQGHITNYSNRIFRATGRVDVPAYAIELGTWRFNQHYTLLPGSEGEYAAFLTERYIPGLLSRRIRVKPEWQGVVGSGPGRILLEGVAGNIHDIADTLVSDEYRGLKRTLVGTYVKQYGSRILAPTGRVEIAFILGEMTRSL